MSKISQTPKIKLNDQTEIPVLGLGTWQLEGHQCIDAVKTALEIGYRHIDTADAYYNHQLIGLALQNSNVARQELFITSKVWRDNLHPNTLISDTYRFLHELQTDYLDLLLIHWPNKNIPIQKTLSAMQEMKNRGAIKSIGVSNFTVAHLKEAMDTGIEISCNQVEFHPSMNQSDLKSFCDQNNIVITAYSPIAQGYDLQLPEVKEIASKYQKSGSQVVLNWVIQKNMITIPRSANRKHLMDNFNTLEWQLDQDDIKKLDHLNQDHRIVLPDFHEFDKNT